MQSTVRAPQHVVPRPSTAAGASTIPSVETRHASSVPPATGAANVHARLGASAYPTLTERTGVGKIMPAEAFMRQGKGAGRRDQEPRHSAD